MSKKALQIEEEKAVELYEKASPEFRAMLESTFGKSRFLKDITERVTSYETACEELGEEPISEEVLIKLGYTDDEIAHKKIKTITKALNEGHVFKMVDTNEHRWYPWFKIAPSSPSGFVVDGSCYAGSTACAGDGSRLCFKNERLSNYAGRQFIGLYARIMK